jgi:uncharacterized membrane protein
MKNVIIGILIAIPCLLASFGISIANGDSMVSAHISFWPSLFLAVIAYFISNYEYKPSNLSIFIANVGIGIWLYKMISISVEDQYFGHYAGIILCIVAYFYLLSATPAVFTEEKE